MIDSTSIPEGATHYVCNDMTTYYRQIDGRWHFWVVDEKWVESMRFNMGEISESNLTPIPQQYTADNPPPIGWHGETNVLDGCGTWAETVMLPDNRHAFRSALGKWEVGGNSGIEHFRPLRTPKQRTIDAMLEVLDEEEGFNNQVIAEALYKVGFGERGGE